MKLYFNNAALQKIAIENREQYAKATPFPHIVLDNVIPDEALDGILSRFPSQDSTVWNRYASYHEDKLETQGEDNLDSQISLTLYQFNSAPFLQFLETISGIKNIIPDPYFYGGGLHQIPSGGKLGIHADFSRHAIFQMDRRINVLIYLNKDWKEGYGGHLELWDPEMKKCIKKILPTYNRMVIFNITDWAFHGHPEPIKCPVTMTRKSIALYYFTNGRPDGETMPGKISTLFMRRPQEVVPAGTEFSRDINSPLDGTPAKQNPKTSPITAKSSLTVLKKITKNLTPPILWDALRKTFRS